MKNKTIASVTRLFGAGVVMSAALIGCGGGGGGASPVSTPVTSESKLAQVKAFFAMLRSNAKALNAADMSLQTELQSVTDDVRGRAVPIVNSSLGALKLTMQGAQMWKDIIANSSAPFVATQTPDPYAYAAAASCSFYSDTNYTVLATSKAEALYIACSTAEEQERVKDVNGVATYCQNTGEACEYRWSTQVRLHPVAGTPGQFAVYTQTRKATIVKGTYPSPNTENIAARESYGAAFPGNVSTLTAQWDGNAKPTTVNLTGELSPSFQSDNNGMFYYDGNYQWFDKPSTTSVLGEKHNVTLSGVVIDDGAVQKLAFSGSADLIKNNAVESAVELSSGSYIQAKNLDNFFLGNNMSNQLIADGSQEMFLKIKASYGNSALLGDIKLSAFKADKSGQMYVATLLNFNGSVERNGATFFEGAVSANLSNHAAFDQSLPLSGVNSRVLTTDMSGKVTIPTRPTLDIQLTGVNTIKGVNGSTSALNGQYRQGSLTINLVGNVTDTNRILTLSSTDGVKMVVDSSKSSYPLTFGADNYLVGVFNTSNSQIEYYNGDIEQF